MRIAGKKIVIEPFPATVLAVLLGAIVAIVFIAPPENAAVALSSTSVLGLIAQGLMRSAIRIVPEGKCDAPMDQK